MTPREFAIWAHKGQSYLVPTKYGQTLPFIAHLDTVGRNVCKVEGIGDLEQALAYLHDVVEDTPVTTAFIRQKFGESIGRGVELLTDPEGPTRAAQKVLLHSRLGKLDEHDVVARAVLIVKAADRTANVEACYNAGVDGYMCSYLREGQPFRRAVYRPGLCDGLWKSIDRYLDDAWDRRLEFGWDDSQHTRWA